MDCCLQNCRDVRVGRFIKADVSVAYLHKAKVRLLAGIFAVVCGKSSGHRVCPVWFVALWVDNWQGAGYIPSKTLRSEL